MKVATSSSRTCTDSAMSSLMAFGCPSASGRVMENTVKLGIPRSSEMVTRGFASRIKVMLSSPCGGETYAILVASSIKLSLKTRTFGCELHAYAYCAWLYVQASRVLIRWQDATL